MSDAPRPAPLPPARHGTCTIPATISLGARNHEDIDATALPNPRRCPADRYVEDVEGWAVFSGDRLPPGLDLGPGIGMAEDFVGETWFLRTEGRGCTSANHRHVLVFRDEDLFREFRQGEVPGETLERSRSYSPPGRVLAFTFRPDDQPQLEPMDLSGCRFALHKDLQRALVAEPSRTEGMIEEDEVYPDDN